MFIMKLPVSLQLRDFQQLLRKLSKFVCNRCGNVFGAAAASGDRVAKWRPHSRRSVSCSLRGPTM
jgi:hypothetical protein